MHAPIPQSQKNIVRTIARKAWRLGVDESGRNNATTAEQVANRDILREIGGAWIVEASELASDLLMYWQANKITEPASIYVAGEPGCGGWDE